MDFHATQSYDASAAEVFECFRTGLPARSLGAIHPLSAPELLSVEEGPERTVVRVRYRFVADLPAAAKRVISADRISWVEETIYDPRTLTAVVEFLPDDDPDRLEASARVRFANVGTGSTRTVSGRLRVRVPLVGGRVERVIVGDLQKWLAEEGRQVARLVERA